MHCGVMCSIIFGGPKLASPHPEARVAPTQGSSAPSPDPRRASLQLASHAAPIPALAENAKGMDGVALSMQRDTHSMIQQLQASLVGIVADGEQGVHQLIGQENLKVWVGQVWGPGRSLAGSTVAVTKQQWCALRAGVWTTSGFHTSCDRVATVCPQGRCVDERVPHQL
eukprot:129033-Chlamydomonas_euryale.AAC.1